MAGLFLACLTRFSGCRRDLPVFGFGACLHEAETCRAARANLVMPEGGGRGGWEAVFAIRKGGTRKKTHPRELCDAPSCLGFPVLRRNSCLIFYWAWRRGSVGDIYSWRGKVELNIYSWRGKRMLDIHSWLMVTETPIQTSIAQ